VRTPLFILFHFILLWVMTSLTNSHKLYRTYSCDFPKLCPTAGCDRWSPTEGTQHQYERLGELCCTGYPQTRVLHLC